MQSKAGFVADMGPNAMVRIGSFGPSVGDTRNDGWKMAGSSFLLEAIGMDWRCMHMLNKIKYCDVLLHIYLLYL